MKVNRFFKKPAGMVSNPLRKAPNVRCPCGSGLKAKKCCGFYDNVTERLGVLLKEFVSTGCFASVKLVKLIRSERMKVDPDYANMMLRKGIFL